jgi:hypothetical protein
MLLLITVSPNPEDTPAHLCQPADLILPDAPGRAVLPQPLP